MKDAIGEFLERNRLKKKFDQTEVISLWKTMFGPVVANRTTQLFFRDGKLYVSLSSSVLRQELSMNKAKIIQSLNEEMILVVVKEIVFK
jgi:predicted nucleic acid-binding Zn ribbon protein